MAPDRNVKNPWGEKTFLREQKNPINFPPDELCHSSLSERGMEGWDKNLDMKNVAEQIGF